jgi:predicted  nucleic acid-binding Zn-ribbon protein
MRTISDFLGRKGVASTSAAYAVPASAKSGSRGAEEVHETTFTDIGTRVGEDNETLRNLLIDTDRRIGALDDLKAAFRSLVEPIGAALQALEQEKTENFGLRNALADLRTGHDSLRGDYSAVEKRATELESAGEELRRDLTLVQQTARGLEADKAELASEIVAARAEIANLESQLAQEAANGRALSEANQILLDHSNAADKRIVELQSETAQTREKLLLLENDKRSLQTALDQTLAETSRLSRRLTESENGLTAARARLEQMDISLAAAENERATLATARDESNERHQSETYALNLRLEALRSRAATAEQLLAEVRQTLVGRTEEIRGLERKVVEASIVRTNTEKTVERLTTARDITRRQNPRPRTGACHAAGALEQPGGSAQGARDLTCPCRAEDQGVDRPHRRDGGRSQRVPGQGRAAHRRAQRKPAARACRACRRPGRARDHASGLHPAATRHFGRAGAAADEPQSRSGIGYDQRAAEDQKRQKRRQPQGSRGGAGGRRGGARLHAIASRN